MKRMISISMKTLILNIVRAKVGRQFRHNRGWGKRLKLPKVDTECSSGNRRRSQVLGGVKMWPRR